MQAEVSRHRIFLLSPAHCGGERARLIFRDGAAFAVARQVRRREGAPLGEVFSFLSGLYFRGKLAYATAFARPPAGAAGILVITAGDGLRPAGERVTIRVLRRYARVPVDPADPRYRRPLRSSAARLAALPDCEFVLLGSIATGKYADVLAEAFGPRLKFPAEFVGRGDMSRGGLMLRCVDAGRELDYVGFEGVRRNGPRPPRLGSRS